MAFKVRPILSSIKKCFFKKTLTMLKDNLQPSGLETAGPQLDLCQSYQIQTAGSVLYLTETK